MAYETVEQPQLMSDTQQSFAIPLALMVALYFGIGFITALNDILVPHFKDLFHLTNAAALLVQFCFFGAYFVMSVPSGWVLGKVGYKAGIVSALALIMFGLLFFQPAARIISYPLFLLGLFVIGSGLALLQVAVNPYIGALGTPQTAPSRLNLAGGFNSIAGTTAPKIGAIFIFIAAGATTAQLAHSVQMPYLVLAACALVMAIAAAVVPLPEVIERRMSADLPTISAWRFRHLKLGALAIFFYVGAEVAVGSIMINYLGQTSMGGLSHTAAARYVSLYWAGAMVGRFIGFFTLQSVRAQRVLAGVSLAGLMLMIITIVANGHLALWAVVCCGLCNSVMWPCIFPLALHGLGSATSQGSGILVTMVVGGAIIPLMQGFLADHLGYQHSFLVVLLCYGYLLYYALSGYQLRSIRHAT